MPSPPLPWRPSLGPSGAEKPASSYQSLPTAAGTPWRAASANSVGAKQLRNGAVTPTKLSKATAAIEAATARYNYEIQLSNLKYQAGVLGSRSVGK